MKKAYLILLIMLIIGQLGAQNKTPIYSFFCAGHTYGNPNNVQFGLHQSFVDYIPTLNANLKMELGFLTGDVVYNPTPQYWDSAQVDMDLFEMPYYIAAGNHDMGAEYTERFGDYYYSFTHREDLFIVLTPGLSQWNIEGDQLAFLEQSLEQYAPQSRYIFIMLHQLIWWSPDNIYQDVIINWIPQYPGSTNFDDVVKPLLLSYPNKIFLYAGDVGSKPSVSPCMYHQYENLTIMASGMGSGNKDNIIITEVYEDYFHIDLVALNGDDPNAMGELSDWAVNVGTHELNSQNYNIFPNPASQYVQIQLFENTYSNERITVSIYNSAGIFIEESELNHTSNIKDISRLSSGLYVFVIKEDGKITETHRVIVE